MWPSTVVWWLTYQGSTFKENWFFQKLLVPNNSSANVKIVCPPLVWKPGLCLTWAVQVLTTAVSALSIWVHCVFITILHLGVLQSFQPHFWNYPSALGRGSGCDRDVQFRIQYFMVLHSLYLYLYPSVGLSVNFFLLQKEASLVRVEKCTNKCA